MENQYLPLGVVLAYPLVFDLFGAINMKGVVLPLFIIILASACTRFYMMHTKYSARLAWERGVLAKHADHKIILNAHNLDADILQMLWGTPYEFWLLSTIERHKSASIIIDDNPSQRPWAANEKKALVVNWNTFPYEQLNGRYFQFTDTTSGYIIDQLR